MGAILLGGLLVAGCGGERGPPTVLQRVDLRPAPDAPPWPRAETVAGFPFPGDWRAQAPTVQLRPDASLRLADPRGRVVLAATLDGSFDLAAFDGALLTLAAAAPGDVAIEFWRGDQRVGATDPVPVVVSDETQALTLSAGDLWDASAPAGRVILKFTDSVRQVDLHRLDLLRHPPAAWLPDPGGEPALVALQGDARLAEGLLPGQALSATISVPARGRLTLSAAWPAACRRGPAAPRLAVSVEAGGALVAQVFPLLDADEDRDAWHELGLDLDSLGGEAASLRIALLPGGEEPTAAAVAEVAIWSAEAAPPTVVLITSDTHRADHLAAAPESVDLLTPALDALAARGVLLADCLATTNVTNPSHMALFTGIHPVELAIDHNSLPLGPAARTLAEVFAEHGYHTAAVISARHLGDPGSGLGQGFDRMSWPEFGAERGSAASVDLARRWLAAAHGRPVFLWLHLFDAHGPYEPSARWAAQYWPAGRDPFDSGLPAPALPSTVLGPGLSGLRDLTWPAAAYKGEVSALDEQLSHLLAEERARAGVVAFTADHGESFGAHGIWFTHAGLYPDTLAVPLVLQYPGGPRGQVLGAPVDQIDLPATLLELAGLPSGELPGRSLVPLLRGGAPPAGARFALAAHAFAASITVGGQHLVLQLKDQAQPQMTSRFRRHQVQLYDLASDPDCERDLAAVDPQRAAPLRERLVAWLDSRRRLDLAGAPTQDPTRQLQLEQLGYLAATADQGPLWEPDACAECLPFLPQDPAGR